MKNIERDACIKIMNEMLSSPLFEPIITKLSSSSSMQFNISDDLKNCIQENDIDLKKVLKDLKNDKYKNRQEWINSIKQIWEKILEFPNQRSIITAIAKEQKEWFQKRILKIPHSRTEEWIINAQNASNNLKNLLKHPPDDCFEPIIVGGYENKLKNKNIKSTQDDD